MSTSNTVPPLLAGQTYFLAVTNPNPIAVTFSLSVCFDVVTLANCEPATNFVVAQRAFLAISNLTCRRTPRHQVSAARSHRVVDGRQQQSDGCAQPTTSAAGPRALRLYQRAAMHQRRILLVVTNSTPFPIQTNRWYVESTTPPRRRFRSR